MKCPVQDWDTKTILVIIYWLLLLLWWKWCLGISQTSILIWTFFHSFLSTLLTKSSRSVSTSSRWFFKEWNRRSWILKLILNLKSMIIFKCCKLLNYLMHFRFYNLALRFKIDLFWQIAYILLLSMYVHTK